MQALDWGIEHNYRSGYISQCTVTGPRFEDYVARQCGQQFGVWERAPSPAGLVAAVLAETGQ